MSPFYERMPDVGGFGIEREIACAQSALTKLAREKDFNQALVAFTTNLKNLAVY
jgi:hypothetical protein